MRDRTRIHRNHGSDDGRGVRLMIPGIVAAAATAIALYAGFKSASDMAHSLSEFAAKDSGQVIDVASLDGWVRPAKIRVEPPRLDYLENFGEILIRPVPLAEPARLLPPEIGTRFPPQGVFVPGRPTAVEVSPPKTEEVGFDESLAPAELERPRVPPLPPIERHD